MLSVQGEQSSHLIKTDLLCSFASLYVTVNRLYSWQYIQMGGITVLWRHRKCITHFETWPPSRPSPVYRFLEKTFPIHENQPSLELKNFPFELALCGFRNTEEVEHVQVNERARTGTSEKDQRKANSNDKGRWSIWDRINRNTLHARTDILLVRKEKVRCSNEWQESDASKCTIAVRLFWVAQEDVKDICLWCI